MSRILGGPRYPAMPIGGRFRRIGFLRLLVLLTFLYVAYTRFFDNEESSKVGENPIRKAQEELWNMEKTASLMDRNKLSLQKKEVLFPRASTSPSPRLSQEEQQRSRAAHSPSHSEPAASRDIQDVSHEDTELMNLEELKESFKLTGGISGSAAPPSSSLTVSEPPMPTAKQIPVIVIACNRPGIARCLDSLFKYRPKDGFPVIVSQDCDHAETSEVIQRYRNKVIHLVQPDQSPPKVLEKWHEEYVAYYQIARHYKWILHKVFGILKFEQAIILEDDMEIAPDFFDYFQAFLPVLKQDPTLMCISAWNDNGKRNRIEDERLFYRSSFFPGLGWMLTRTFWQELEPIWPPTFWDDWLRHPLRHKNRACIRPEVSRVFNFGKGGISGGLYYDEHIGTVVLNEKPATFGGFDPSTGKLLESSLAVVGQQEGSAVDVRSFLKSTYDPVFLRQVYELSQLTTSEELQMLVERSDPERDPLFAQPNPNQSQPGTPEDFAHLQSPYFCGRNCRRRFRIEYEKQPGWDKEGLGPMVELMKQWRLMGDIREDLARGSYLDILPFKVPLKQVVKHGAKLNDALVPEEKFIMVYIAPKSRPQP